MSSVSTGMSAKDWLVDGRKTSALFNAFKAVGCARSGNHAVRVILLRGAVAKIGVGLVSYVNVYLV